MTVADQEKIRMNVARVVAAGIARATKSAPTRGHSMTFGASSDVTPEPESEQLTPYVDAMEARFAAAEKRLKSRIGYREAA